VKRRHRRQLRKALRRGAIVFAGLVVALLIAELVVRAGGLAPLPDAGLEGVGSDNSEHGCHVPHQTRGWAAAADTCGRDQHGMIPDPAADGSPVVLVVGDSIATLRTWLNGTGDALREVYPEAQVLSAGHSGYNTCQEYQLVRELIGPVHPDLVVLQTCPNDIGGSPVLVPLGEGRMRYFVGDRSFDAPGVLFYSHLATAALVRFGAATLAEPSAFEGSAGVAYFDSCLSALRDTLVSREIPLVAVHFPVLAAPGVESERPHFRKEAHIVEQTTALAIPALELRPLLEAQGDMASHRPDDLDYIHPNKQAQALIGDALGPWLLEHLAAPGAQGPPEP